MKNLTAFFLLLSFSSGLFSQNAGKKIVDELADLVDELTGIEIKFQTATFKSTRIMNGHSVERMPARQLDFRISHRFGKINSGAYNFFGLDQANMHLGLEYGITDWLMIGVGRGNYEKTFDGFTKFTVVRQSVGAKSFPLSLSLLSTAALRTVKPVNPSETISFASRMSYTGQILVARKINQYVSVQLMPSYVRRELPETGPHNLWALGAGGRVKLAKRVSLNAEYYYQFNPEPYMYQDVYNPLSIGFDIETGGHVFQLIFTNSTAMIEKGFIGETTGSWGKGDIRFGFNISRVFSFKK
ncbi:MAG: hypothetical protein HPY62_03290 [Bacteroidales bacterium]|nr:hypothetical protein [Bacteroidales bacterium]